MHCLVWILVSILSVTSLAGVAFAQIYKGDVDPSYISVIEQGITEALISYGFSITSGREIRLSECNDAFQLGAAHGYFPSLTEAAAASLLNEVNKISRFKAASVDLGLDSESVSKIFAGYSVSVRGESVTIAAPPDDTVLIVDSIEYLVHRLNVILQNYGNPSIQVGQPMCPASITYVSLVVEPPGARIWWSTPFRQYTCQAASDVDACGWREITGSDQVAVNGDRIFRAEWQNGQRTISVRSGNDAVHQVLLRAN
jgi:hypothetical protein